MQVETQDWFTRANHALCAYVCYYEILAMCSVIRHRINNGWSLLCAAFHSPHLLYRKRVRESPESKMRYLFFFFFFPSLFFSHLFSINRAKTNRGEKKRRNNVRRIINARIRVTIVCDNLPIFLE